LALDSSVYFVMKHYGLSLKDIDDLSTEQFSTMFTWAVAVSTHEAEEAEKENRQSQSSMQVAGTKMGGPMPHSDGSW